MAFIPVAATVIGVGGESAPDQRASNRRRTRGPLMFHLDHEFASCERAAFVVPPADNRRPE
jgi:hypothetical protein